MRKYSSLFWYVALFLISFLVDRATKFFALSYFHTYKINNYIKFELMFNRGISWGMFDSQSSLIFFLVTTFIVIITLFVAVYGYKQFQAGHTIIGELLVIAGSLSNIFDRILYGGVIDFIALSWGKLSWPVFNLADVFIVAGVFIIMIGVWAENN